MNSVIGVVLALIALLGGYASWQSNKAASALEKLDAVIKQLDALQRGVEANNEALVALDGRMAAVAKKAVTVRERVIQLERSDEKIRAFLDTPLPDNGCMLDDSCGAGNISKPSTAPTVPAPVAGGK